MSSIEPGHRQQLALPPYPGSLLQECLELQACGCFRRQTVLKTISALQPELSPAGLVSLVVQLVEHNIFSLQLLQALLPDPQQAALIIFKATCSHPTLVSAAPQQQEPAVNTGTAANVKQPHMRLLKPQPCTAAAFKLLQLLLEYGLSAELQSSSNMIVTQAIIDWPADIDTALISLDQYMLRLLHALQQIAAKTEVLAVHLFQAAACTMLANPEAVSRWMKQQVTDMLAPGKALTPLQQQAAAIAGNSWATAAYSHTCWFHMLVGILRCCQLQELLQWLQRSMQEAVTSAEGLNRLRGMLTAVCWRNGNNRTAVQHMLRDALSRALKDGAVAALLPALLMAQAMTHVVEYDQLLQAAVEDSLVQDTAAGGTGRISCLIKAMRLTLPGSQDATLQAHLQVLKQLNNTGLGNSLKHNVTTTEQLLGDVLHTLQQEERQQQAASTKTSVKLKSNDRGLLEQFKQVAPVQTPNGIRRLLTGQLLQYWQMYRGYVPKLCEALTHSQPDSPEDARLRLGFVMAFRDKQFCSVAQLDAMKQSYQDWMEDFESSAAGCGTEDSAKVQLQKLLDSLPREVARSKAAALLVRVTGCLQQIHLQHQQQLQDADLAPAQKKQCLLHDCQQDPATAAFAATAAKIQPATVYVDRATDTASHEQLVCMLLLAHDRTAEEGTSKLSLDWRLSYIQMLQHASWLHKALLEQLMASMNGSIGSGAANQQKQVAHGRLVALMASCKPSQMQILQPGLDALVAQVDTATARFSWRITADPNTAASMSAAATATFGGMRCAENQYAADLVQQLCGCELVQHLLSHTNLASRHERCCAASFWAGYVCELQHLGSYYAGPLGPFCTSSPSSSMQHQQQHQQEQPKVLGYMPQQLVALLQYLGKQLGLDAEAVVTEGRCNTQGAEMARQCHMVCSKLLSSPPVQWATEKMPSLQR